MRLSAHATRFHNTEQMNLSPDRSHPLSRRWFPGLPRRRGVTPRKDLPSKRNLSYSSQRVAKHSVRMKEYTRTKVKVLQGIWSGTARLSKVIVEGDWVIDRARHSYQPMRGLPLSPTLRLSAAALIGGRVPLVRLFTGNQYPYFR